MPKRKIDPLEIASAIGCVIVVILVGAVLVSQLVMAAADWVDGGIEAPKPRPIEIVSYR